MDWNAPHAAYVIAAYAVAAKMILWCVADTIIAYRKRAK